MSSALHHELSKWKDLLAKLRGSETTWRGIPLSRVDHETWTESILFTGMVLYDLSNRYEGLGTYRDHVLWCINATNTDVSEMATILSEAILYLRLIEPGHKDGYASFIRHMRSKAPRSGVVLAPVKGAVTLFLGDPTAHNFGPVYQFLSFLTHLTLLDIDMSDELETGFLDNEDRVRNHAVPPFYMSQLNGIMREWFRDWEIGNFLPGHGPGSVAELRGDTSLDSKYRLLKPDQLIRTVFSMCAGIDVSTYLPLRLSGVTARQSQIVFVPKSMKTKRVISKEPATLQYFQQGISRSIDRYVRKSRTLRQHIDLHDQERQRRMALDASRTRDYATVDLSAASDSVSYALVRGVFAGTPLYPYLVALRSRTVELPSGKVLEVAKFAPMGSALCFPIETLVFAAICECTVRYVRQTTGISYPEYGVYGDDIIIADPCLEDLKTNLRLCGFTLNEGKSYAGTARFRESCGCDAFDGVDVTPMKIGRRYSSRLVHVRSAGLFAGLMVMANQAHDYGFLLLRRYLVDKLLHTTGFHPIFSTDGSVGLFSPQPTNYHLKQRWNKWLHRDEVRAAVVFTEQSQSGALKWDANRRQFVKHDPEPGHEEIRYFEWLRRSECRSGDPLGDEYARPVSTGSAGVYISKRWVVKP